MELEVFCVPFIPLQLHLNDLTPTSTVPLATISGQFGHCTQLLMAESELDDKTGTAAHSVCNLRRLNMRRNISYDIIAAAL